MERQADAVLTRAEEMIYKEQNILFPICAVNFTEEEWYGIYHDEKDYDLCFWRGAGTLGDCGGEEFPPSSMRRERSSSPGGHMTLEQLTALLNTIPLEITFVDADNINRFSMKDRRSSNVPAWPLTGKCSPCHPPKIEPMVRQIIDDFRNNRRDEVPRLDGEGWPHDAGEIHGGA